MNSIQRQHTDARMSQIVVHNGTVYLAGQVPTDLTAPIAEQTREVLSKIDRLLEEAGSSKAHILSATLFLRDLDQDFALANAEWEAWIPAGAAPARATVEGRMVKPDVLIEICIVAAQR